MHHQGCTNHCGQLQPDANTDDGSCVGTGCTYPGADNYDAVYTVEDGSCVFSGCTDASAENYVAFANNDDGSCIFEPCTGESLVRSIRTMTGRLDLPTCWTSWWRTAKHSDL